jgi:hypothetical protein
MAIDIAPKFNLLPTPLQEEIYTMAREKGAWATSLFYASKISMNQVYLSLKLKKYLKNLEGESLPTTTSSSKPIPKPWEKPVKKLTKAEEAFLDGIKKGSIPLEEASKVIASMVFEKMLRNPEDIRFIDFFRTELLKLKQQESQDRNNLALEMINRMFSGNLPPKICPKCGYELYQETKMIEGEVVDEPL